VLAPRACLSPRQFDRMFVRELGIRRAGWWTVCAWVILQAALRFSAAGPDPLARLTL